MDTLSLKCSPPDKEPLLDIAICSECGWRGDISNCETEQEGAWETGYYAVHLCPKCEDGGCIDNYDYSPEMEKEWHEWDEKRKAIKCESK